jgi:hypothetical protein
VLRALGEGKWEVVVLQEQSTIPSFDRERRAPMMDAFARRLHEEVVRARARTLLYVTWGYRDGDPQNRPGDTYAAMQDRLEQSYREVARELDATVVPVGEAWRIAHEKARGLDLWAPDGRHPSRAGTYLAACTFYGVLYKKSPLGNPFTAGLSREEAQVLQKAASTALARFSRELGWSSGEKAADQSKNHLRQDQHDHTDKPSEWDKDERADRQDCFADGVEHWSDVGHHCLSVGQHHHTARGTRQNDVNRQRSRTERLEPSEERANPGTLVSDQPDDD